MLADSIQLSLPLLVKIVVKHSNKMESNFSGLQESRRKDIERAFSVMQEKIHIIAVSRRLWSRRQMNVIIQCFFISQKMMVD